MFHIILQMLGENVTNLSVTFTLCNTHSLIYVLSITICAEYFPGLIPLVFAYLDHIQCYDGMYDAIP